MVLKQILPKTIAPMLAATADGPFDSPDYLYEVKWDGIRCLAFLEAATRLQSRNLHDITYRYPDLLELHSSITGQPAVLDGEIVVLRDGKPSFEDLQKRDRMTAPGRIAQAARERPAIFVAFDLLYWKGQAVTNYPLARRRELLKQSIEESDVLVLSQSVKENGIDYCRAVFAQGLEGVMAKRLDSRYFPGKRTKNWVKIKRTTTINAVIAGLAESPGTPHRFGSLILGLFARDGSLRYVGHAGTGFTEDDLRRLLAQLDQDRTDAPTVSGVPRDVARKAVWLRPRLSCRVEYLEFTSAGRLRHAVYRGLSTVPPPECTMSQLR